MRNKIKENPNYAVFKTGEEYLKYICNDDLYKKIIVGDIKIFVDNFNLLIDFIATGVIHEHYFLIHAHKLDDTELEKAFLNVNSINNLHCRSPLQYTLSSNRLFMNDRDTERKLRMVFDYLYDEARFRRGEKRFHEMPKNLNFKQVDLF